MATCAISHVSREANHMQLVFNESQASLCASRGIGPTYHISSSFSLVTPALVFLVQSKLTFISHHEVDVSSRWLNCLPLPPCPPPRTPWQSSRPLLTSKPSYNPNRRLRSPSLSRWLPCSSSTPPSGPLLPTRPACRSPYCPQPAKTRKVGGTTVI